MNHLFGKTGEKPTGGQFTPRFTFILVVFSLLFCSAYSQPLEVPKASLQTESSSIEWRTTWKLARTARPGSFSPSFFSIPLSDSRQFITSPPIQAAETNGVARSTSHPTPTPNPSGTPVVHSTPSPSPDMAYLFIKLLLRNFVNEEISEEIELNLADTANIPEANVSLVNLQAGPILTYVIEAQRNLAPSLVQTLTFYIKSGQLAASINEDPIILVDDPIEFSESGQPVNDSQVAPGLHSTPLPTAGFHRVIYEIRFNNFTTNIFTAAINDVIEEVLAQHLHKKNVSDIRLTNLFNCSGNPPYVVADYITVFPANVTTEAINQIYKFLNSGAMQNLTDLDVAMLKMPKTMESLLQTSSSSQPTGAIIGGSVGGFIGLVIVIGVIVLMLYVRRRRKLAKMFGHESELSDFNLFGKPFPRIPPPAWIDKSNSSGEQIVSDGTNDIAGPQFFSVVHHIDSDLEVPLSSHNKSFGTRGNKELYSAAMEDIRLPNGMEKLYHDKYSNNSSKSIKSDSGLEFHERSLKRYSDITNYLDISREAEDAPWEIPFEELEVMDCIGVGGFGIVYAGSWNGTKVAIKKLLFQDLTESQIEEFRAEAKMMSRLRHPNIVLFLGATTVPPNLSIVTELMTLGSLYKVLHGSTKSRKCVVHEDGYESGSSSSQTDMLLLSWKERLLMTIDAARGLNYLHQRRPPVVHRDLKSLNLLVSENLTVKVSDFGLSRVKNRTFLTSRHCGGTPEWTAPEVLRSEQHNEKADIYSFGVVMWEMVTRKVPFEGMTSMQIIAAVGFRNQKLPSPCIPNPLPPSLTGLDKFNHIMESCFVEPSRRPSMAHILVELCNIVENQSTDRTGNPPLRKVYSSSVVEERVETPSPGLRRLITSAGYSNGNIVSESEENSDFDVPERHQVFRNGIQFAPLDFSQLE